ncbi:MAG: putative sugar O-methyltransferase [Betaproteobacteria bacterium]|nr:putative sugar O-methyltransferase [Betaproteobacteria bacterium]
MGLSREQSDLLELMRADNARAGFPFAASQFWAKEAGDFQRVFDVTGISKVENEYFNTRYSGITMNDPRLYEWFISTFYHLIRSRDPLDLLARLQATADTAAAHAVTLGGINVEFGPPVTIDGRRISADLLFSIYDFYNLYELNPAVASEALVIGDLGAGWGRIGYVLLKVNPRLRYLVFDIPESLLVSSAYLPQLLPELERSSYLETRGRAAFSRQDLMQKALWFLGSQDLLKLPANAVDLMVNVASFQEMSADQVNRYLAIFDEVVFGGHVYLRNNYVGVSSRVDQYRIPEGWLRRFVRASAYSPQFYEAGWRVT